MLQIVIWGIAIMLVVKSLDVLHQQVIARSAGNDGAQGLAMVTAGIGFVGALTLVFLAHGQTSAMPQGLGTSGVSSFTDAETDNMTAVDAMPTDDELANMAAVDARGAN